MSIRTLDPNRSLQSHDEVLIHDEARLAANPRTKHLAPPFLLASERLSAVERHQRLCLYAVIRARALVAHWDNTTDSLNEEIARELLHIAKGDRTSPRYLRYYKHRSPHEISELGLANQLDATESWPQMLADEPEPVLVAFSAQYADCLTSGRAVLKARTDAEIALADHRTRHILPLVADLNTLREHTFAELIKLFGKRGAKLFFL